MKVAIAGAGAMGCRFGYMLADSGVDVTLIDGWKTHVDAINQQGLFVETESGSRHYSLPAMLAEDAHGEFDVVILFTKAMQMAEMLRKIAPVLASAKVVMTLSNGLGNIETLEQYVDRSVIYAGVTLWSCELEGPGHIRATGSGNIELQPLMSTDMAMAGQVVDMLNHAGLNAELSANVLLSIWKKAAFNSVMNTYCALLDCNVGGFGRRPDALEMARTVVREIVQVARSQQIPLTEEMVMHTVQKVFDPRESGEHYPSMHQDLHKGRFTEIDYLNGAVARMGEALGIPVPVNRLLTQLIHAKEVQ
ncbi:oxidoreductase [Pseudocitrobacter corydidari]